MEQPTVTTTRRVRRDYLAEATSLVTRLRQLNDRIDKAEAIEKASVKAAQDKRIEHTRELVAEKADILQQLTQLLREHKRFFWARYGKTLVLKDGVVRYRTEAPSLVTPKDTTAIINFLLRIRGGSKRYLTFKPALNRDALTHASPELLRMLASLGVHVSKHATIGVKTTGQANPISLSRERYPRRRRTRQH